MKAVGSGAKVGTLIIGDPLSLFCDEILPVILWLALDIKNGDLVQLTLFV